MSFGGVYKGKKPRCVVESSSEPHDEVFLRNGFDVQDDAFMSPVQAARRHLHGPISSTPPAGTPNGKKPAARGLGVKESLPMSDLPDGELTVVS